MRSPLSLNSDINWGRWGRCTPVTAASLAVSSRSSSQKHRVERPQRQRLHTYDCDTQIIACSNFEKGVKTILYKSYKKALKIVLASVK